MRPVQPEDKERLQEGLKHLSSESRYLRFMGGKKRLSQEELRRFTELDWSRHQVSIAVDSSQNGEPALGVATCVGLEDEPKVAEVAVAVVDSVHGKGLGTLPLSIGVESAVDARIRTFALELSGVFHCCLLRTRLDIFCAGGTKRLLD